MKWSLKQNLNWVIDKVSLGGGIIALRPIMTAVAGASHAKGNGESTREYSTQDMKSKP